MKSRTHSKNAPPRPDATLSSRALIGLLAWSAIASAYFYAKTDIGFQRGLDQWILTPFALAPSFSASIRHLSRLSALAAFTVIFVGTGHRLLRACAIAFQDIPEELALSFGLGYGTWGTLLLLAGLAGAWSRKILLTALALGGILALLEIRTCFKQTTLSPSEWVKDSTILERACFGGFLIVWLFNLRSTLAPETFYDALHYHLALPNIYLMAGRILPTPENSYSGMPALPQMLYGWTLAADPWGVTAALLHCSLAIWVGCVLIAICRRIGRPLAGALAAVCFFVTPVVLGENFRTSVGMEWTLLEACCFLSFLSALSSEPGSIARRQRLVLSGIFLGFSMSAKYPAWLLPLSLLPALLLRFSAPEKNRTLSRLVPSELLLILTVAGICLAPWIVKNIWFYRNPIYPFLHEYFARGAEYLPNWRKVGAVGAGAIGINTYAGLLSWPGLIRFISLPINFLTPFEGAYQSIGLFCVCFAPLLFIIQLSPEERLLGWFCLAAWIPLALVSSETRFFIPHLALATALICCVLVRIDPSKVRNWLLFLSCLLWSTTGFIWMVATASPERNDVFLGRMSYGEYLRHARTSYPTPPYAGIEYLNRLSPEKARVLMYGDGRSFYLNEPYLAASTDQTPILEVWANESSSAEVLKNRVDSEGIKYILINLGEMARLRTAPQTSAQGLMNLAEFWKRYTARDFGVQDRLDRWVGVYRILNSDEASKPHSTDDLFSNLASKAAAGKN